MKAIWNDEVIAESDDTVVVEGNHYFPKDSINEGLLRPSDKTSVCSWKGTANYYTLAVNGKENPDAAWYYSAAQGRSPSDCRACRILERRSGPRVSTIRLTDGCYKARLDASDITPKNGWRRS